MTGNSVRAGSDRWFIRVVVATVFLINMHTWGMNSVRLFELKFRGRING